MCSHIEIYLSCLGLLLLQTQKYFLSSDSYFPDLLAICRYQLRIIQRKLDQLQLDNKLSHKAQEKLTRKVFLSLKLLNVLSIMTDIKQNITKNIHILRVNLSSELSEACTNIGKDVPNMRGKKMEDFIVDFLSSKTGQKDHLAINHGI